MGGICILLVEATVNLNMQANPDELLFQANQVMIKLSEHQIVFVNRRVGGQYFMKYAVAIEKVESNFSAFVLDLPACVATGFTIEVVEEQIREAIEFHIEGMRQDNQPPAGNGNP